MRTACLLALAWAAAAAVVTDAAPPTPPAPKADTPRYNCLSREVWSAEKTAWCCEHKQLRCTTDTMPAAAVRERDGKRSVSDIDNAAPARKSEEKEGDATDAEAPERKRGERRTRNANGKRREDAKRDDGDAATPEKKSEEKEGDETDAEAPERKKGERSTHNTDGKKKETRRGDDSDVAPERKREERGNGHYSVERDESSEKNETRTFNCRTRATLSEDEAAWCCKNRFAGCSQKHIAEQTSRDILKSAEERKAGHKRRGLRMTIAGDKDELKSNPRALLKRVRKVLLKASAFLRKHPSALVVKQFNASGEDVPIFREWNDELAKEEELESGDGRQALSLQVAGDIGVSYDIVSPTAADVDAAVDEVASSLGAAATTPREDGDADHQEDCDHEGEEGDDGKRGVVKYVVFALVALLGCAALAGLVVFAVYKRRNTTKVDETKTNTASAVDGVPLKDCESQLGCSDI